MSEISLLSPGAEIARWAVLPRWAVFGKFPLHGDFFRAYSNSRITVELLGNYCRITVELLHNLNYCRITVELIDWTLYRCTNSFSPL